MDTTDRRESDAPRGEGALEAAARECAAYVERETGLDVEWWDLLDIMRRHGLRSKCDHCERSALDA